MSNDVRVNFTANTSNFQSGINKVSGALKGLAGTLGAVMAPLAALAGGVAFGAGIKDILSYGGRMSDLANRTGLAASEIVVLEEAFRQAGLEGADVATTLQKLSKNILVGMETETSKVALTMKKLGLTMQDVAGLNMAQQFDLVSAKIGALSSDQEKAAAASALFGAKQGLLLINLFKTKNAMEEARTVVGGLGISMDRWAASFDYIDDMLGALPIKIRQFFAAFVGNNLGDLTLLADTIKTLDLTNAGAKVGKLLEDISNGIKNGKIGETLWIALKYPVQKLGEELVSVFEYAAQHLAKSIENSLKGSKLGDYLGIGKNASYTTFNPFTGMSSTTSIPYKGIEPENLGDIRNRNKNLFGSEDTADLWNKITTPKVVMSLKDMNGQFIRANLGSIEAIKDLLTRVEVGSDYKDSQSKIPGKWDGILKFVEAFEKGKGKKSEEYNFRGAITSSLGRIGGGGGGWGATWSKDPLVAIQKESLEVNKQIRDSVKNMANNKTTGAVWQ